jgi:hypothetical protein
VMLLGYPEEPPGPSGGTRAPALAPAAPPGHRR